MVDELHLGQVNGEPVTGNGVCLHFSPPTESLFLTLQSAPGVYRSWCFASVMVDGANNNNKASNGVWLKTDESENSNKETASSRKKKDKGKKYKSSTLKKLESESKDNKIDRDYVNCRASSVDFLSVDDG